MRIALLQLRVEPGARSANLAHTLRRIVRSAELVPPPDLIVLPAWCDGHHGGEVTQAMAQGFSESLAAAAREWGVYLTAGSLVSDGADAVQCARMYDPDGDVIARSTGSNACDVAETPLGRIAVWLDGQEVSPKPPLACDMLLVLGCWRAEPRERQRAAAELQSQLSNLAGEVVGSVVCSAGPVTDSALNGGVCCIGGTAAYGADGQCLAAADVGADQT
ncbi:MAG: carbon-nitrogen hydrolase family protein, partial [Planctomycetota bacterium]